MPHGWDRLATLARPHLDGFDALDGKDGLLARAVKDIPTVTVFDGIGRGNSRDEAAAAEELGNKIECG